MTSPKIVPYKAFLIKHNECTHIMFYIERFIRYDFRTNQNFEKNKEYTTHFSKKQGTLYCIDGFCKEQQIGLNFQFHPKYIKS